MDTPRLSLPNQIQKQITSTFIYGICPLNKQTHNVYSPWSNIQAKQSMLCQKPGPCFGKKKQFSIWIMYYSFIPVMVKLNFQQLLQCHMILQKWV